MAVRCDIIQCKDNGGHFCNRSIVILKNGQCQVPYDKNGLVRPQEFWVKQDNPVPPPDQKI